MKPDWETSQRLDILRFPLIVGVVFIHAYETHVGLADQIVGVSQNGFFCDFIRNLISQGLARAAVPLFFLTSGYLFFAGFDGTCAAYKQKLKSRVRSLLVPFLFWNLLVLTLTALLQALPQTQSLFSGRQEAVASYSFYDYVDAIFGIDRYPVAYQFWFIRDLMILVLLVPLLRMAGKYAPLPLLAILAVGWFGNFLPMLIPSVLALLFFSAGMVAALYNKNLFLFDRYAKYIAVIYAPLLVANAVFFDMPAGPVLFRLTALIGVIAALCATKPVLQSPRLKQKLLELGRSSFFVYAAHEPLLTMARKLAYKTLDPHSTALVLLLYFLIPVTLIVFLVLVHRALMRVMPKTLSVITGGR